jgi:hypothetical protein
MRVDSAQHHIVTKPARLTAATNIRRAVVRVVSHAVAELEARDVSPRVDNFACELVAEWHRAAKARSHVAKVEIRAADARGRDLDHHIAWTRNRSYDLVDTQISRTVNHRDLHARSMGEVIRARKVLALSSHGRNVEAEPSRAWVP